MSVLIDVGTVLKGTVCDLYSNLVTRPTGAAVRTAIERQFFEVGAPAVTTIDFSQVNLLDFSCADEIVAKLLMRFTSADAPPGYLTFRGIHEGHIDPIETVLEHHGLALVSWHEGEAELFGPVDDDEREHWLAVRQHGPVRLEDVARVLDRDVDESHACLDRLSQRRLVMTRDDGYAIPGAVRGAA